MYKKKISTIAIITILTLSILLAAIPMAHAEILSPPYVFEKGTTTPIAGGPVGTKVDVVANSTSGEASPFSTVTVYWDALSGAVLGTGSADIDGIYNITVTIPPATFGTHYIVVNDGETESSGAPFDVSPTLSANVTRALPGDFVTVTGHGYAPANDIVLTLNSTIISPSYGTTITVVPITNGTGSFSVTFVVPAIAIANYTLYNLNATDEATNMASTTLNIDYYITLTPDTGPTGITTTISGRIKASVAYTITFNAAQIAAGTTGADGSYSAAYTIPGVLSPAGYPVEITWETTNTRSATFTVTAAPTISLGVSTGVAGAVVTITGSGFSGSADITLYFDTTVVNTTAMGFGPTTSGGALPAGATFVVPTLAPLVYSVSVVDEYGATSASGVFFTITPTPVTSITLRGTSYYPGDILSFNIFTTDAFTSGPDVTIRDPSGAIWWTATGWTLTASGTSWSVLYQAQMVNNNYLMLSADAPLGTWNWTIMYTGTAAGAAKATGLFAVAALPSMQTVLDQLDTMEASIKSVVTTSEGKIIVAVNTKAGQIIADLSDLDAQITRIDGDLSSIDGVLVTISTSIGDIQTTLSNLDMGTLGVDITAIKGDVATIKTNLGTVTTSVSGLSAKVTSLSGDVATVSTTLGTLTGKVTSIEGSVATIDTEVGTLQADISTIKDDVATIDVDVDMTPAWIAVVLSLVAAIAAIFAVITIRQKIAG